MFYWLRPLLHNAYWGGWLAMAGSLDHFLSGGGRDRERREARSGSEGLPTSSSDSRPFWGQDGCGLELQWDAVDIASCLMG